MMRSPSKDFFMDVEEPTSSKDGLWDYGGNAFVTSQPNTSSPSCSFNEKILHGTEANPVQPVNQIGENSLNDTTEIPSKSPCKKQTARKSLARGSSNNPGNSDEQNTEIKLEPNLDDDSANIAAKVLHFFCQKCKNGIRYSPNDLQKHFLISHNGELPLYPCEMCNFSASDFQEFKQHRKTHRSALVKCEICNNDYSYTLLGLTKHFSNVHCVNGHFSCSKCRFTTRDVGTFVQHIHRHNGIEYACQKCNHISYSKAEFQRHLQGHSTMLPFSCQYCSYSAMRKDFIVKHILAKHTEHVHSKEEHIVEGANTQMAQTNTGPKLVSKKSQIDAPEKSWRQDSTEKPGENIERSNSFHFKSPDKDLPGKDIWVNVNSDQPVNDGMSSVTTVNCNKEDSNSQGSLGFLQNIVHGPTVLMVKNNKITVPANYSATFVGYKMVNGKQNLVIKLLPSNKQAANNTSQPSPQSSNSLPRFSHSTNHGLYGAANTVNDNRSTSSFKPSSLQNSSAGTPAEKQSTTPLQTTTASLGSLRKNESFSRLGTLNRQPSFEPPHKNAHNFNASISSATGRKIKEEPAEYNINEHQFFDNETSKDRMHSSSTASSRFIDPTTGFLYKSAHSSDSGGKTSSTTMYSKDLNSSLLHSSTASGLGNFSCPTFPSKNSFALRGVPYNDRFPKPMEMNKNDNLPFMPRITSVFSLQSRLPDPKPFGKNTYLHNILQDNKRLNDKVCPTKPSGPFNSNNTSAFSKQPMSNTVPRFDSRMPNGNVASSVFLKQEPDSSGSGIKTYNSMRTSELLKTHSDSIVNQQLAKDRIGTITKPSGTAAFHLLRPQASGMSQSNNVFYPSGSNRFTLPVLSSNHPSVRMMTSQANAPTTSTFSNPNRINAPVMLNTKPGMVLTIANGPFGTIRNMSNVNSSSSQLMGNVSGLGRLALPRLPRPPVPHILKSDLGTSPNNLSANIISGSPVNSKLPINLNVLQYCVNSDGSRGTATNMESSKQPQSVQKQPVYAFLPDGKQAVLLNYVLPNSGSSTNTQKTVQLNQISRKLLPKKPEEVQQPAFLRNSDQINTLPASSVKEEDTSAFDGYGGNVPANRVSNAIGLQSKPTERKQCLRSNSSSAASVEEHLSPTSDDKTVSQPFSSSKSKSKSKQSMSTFSSKNRSCKRKISDAGSYEADVEFKTKKRVSDFLQEVPRKQMLHRKCKAKSYTSEVDSPPEMPSPMPTPPPSPPPEPTKDVVRTLRLFPFSGNQLVKYPQRDQPVVVLNHPDADVPEVMNVMRTISKFNGHVLKVSLSKRTIEALLESRLLSSSEGRRLRRSKPMSPVKERFVLKLTLKKTSKNNYKIVKNTPTDKLQTKFNCWFCGRVFDNQDEWVGHGQRHLMEATKDWNTLF